MRMNISVVFYQYNPRLEKVLYSLYSIISQKGITFEIIIVDDGSKEDYFGEIKSFFDDHEFTKYCLHKNQNNIGTVKNFLSGIELAQGEYIFGNSPGDILFDEFALRDFYQFAIRHNADCFFAKAVYYENKNECCKTNPVIANPQKPNAFGRFMPKIFGKYALFYGDGILGSVFLRKKDYALRYLSEVSSTAKYLEDYTSSFLSVMDGERIIYYNRVILWYEMGGTRPKEVEDWWYEALNTDREKTSQMIKEHYGADPLYSFFDLKKSRIIRKIKHPYILLVSLIYSFFFFKQKTISSTELSERINNYIHDVSKKIPKE